MKIIKSTFNRYISYEDYFNNKSVCFIDIETTGLSKRYNSIYLIGVLYYDKSNDYWILKQLFAENMDEEKVILLEFSKLISSYELILTYNGETFDIPFINERMKKHKIPYELENTLSMDIYKIVKSNKYLIDIENLKLKSLEKYLGLAREDIYTGKDCIQFYLDYIKSKDEILMTKILQHNYDDLYYMIDILKILDIIKERKTFTIDYNNEKIKLLIDKLTIVGDQLVVNGLVEDNKQIKIIYYGNDYSISFDDNFKYEIGIEFSIGMVSPTEKGYYIDLNRKPLPSGILDRTKYNLPKNIFLLKVDKQYYIENIKSLLIELLDFALNN